MCDRKFKNKKFKRSFSPWDGIPFKRIHSRVSMREPMAREEKGLNGCQAMSGWQRPALWVNASEELWKVSEGIKE